MNAETVAKFAQAIAPRLMGMQFTQSITVGALAGGLVTAIGSAALVAGLIPTPWTLAFSIGFPIVVGGIQLAVNVFTPDKTKELITGLAQKALNHPQAVAKDLPPPSQPKTAETTLTAPEAAAVAVIASQTPSPLVPAATVTLEKH